MHQNIAKPSKVAVDFMVSILPYTEKNLTVHSTVLDLKKLSMRISKIGRLVLGHNTSWREVHYASWFYKMQDIPPPITQVCMHIVILSCPDLVPKVRVGSGSKEELCYLVEAFEAGCSQCCHTILYGRMRVMLSGV